MLIFKGCKIYVISNNIFQNVATNQLEKHWYRLDIFGDHSYNNDIYLNYYTRVDMDVLPETKTLIFCVCLFPCARVVSFPALTLFCFYQLVFIKLLNYRDLIWDI